MSMLGQIKPVLINVANAIGVILGIDIVVCDDEGNFIAHNDTYIQRKGTDHYRPFSRGIIESGMTTIVDSPGKHILCKGCPNENNCPQTLEVLIPFDYNNKTIGYISAVSFSEEMREEILSKQTEILSFLEQMKELIIRAVHEHEVTNQLNRTMDEMVTVMNSVDSGIISCDVSGVIVNCNSISSNQLKLSHENLIGMNIRDLFPGCYAVDEVLVKGNNASAREYPYIHKGVNTKVVIAGKKIANMSGKIEGAVFITRSIKDILECTHNTQGQTIDYEIGDIIGVSKVIKELKSKILSIASNQSTVFIRGETGTGKELVARAIHASGKRRDKPFVAINCAAIPDTLLEGELFGYEDGSFTGGRSGGKAGKFEYADGGTVFLDEIGDMQLHLQAKILRTLQEKAVERIGGSTPIQLDIRVISATHQDIEKKISLNEFREDLYYRLNVIPLMIPPLRERIEDINPIAERFVWKYSRIAEKEIRSIDKDFLEALQQYEWPGNIRQLQNAIEYAVAFEETDILSLKNLPPSIKSVINSSENSENSENSEKYKLEIQVESTEKALILRALRENVDDPDFINATARSLGISRATLYRKAKKTGVVLVKKSE